MECKLCHLPVAKKDCSNHLQSNHADEFDSLTETCSVYDSFTFNEYSSTDVHFRKQGSRKTKHRNSVFCFHCNKGFQSKYLLEDHVLDCKNKQKENLDSYRIAWGEDMVRYQCPTCQIVLKRKDTLRHHLKLHTGEKFVTCEQCGKQLHGVYAFKRHLKSVHLKIKDLCCDLCGKAFSCQTNLAAHKKTHSGDKPYVCETCGKSFAQNASLKYHHDTVHALVKKRLFQCSQCPKKFYRNSKLNAHLKIHTEERAYFCDICNHSFKTDNEVKKHKRFVHTDERPHSCQYCSATFKKSDHLKRHSKTPHKEMYQSEDTEQQAQTILLDPRCYVHPYIPYQTTSDHCAR
uniref:Zinc finger protein 112 n=1 Tax=Cacopsylla melanoneura TaxID=428564 RepID=A0A8D8SZ40_9HEMI